MHCQPPILVKMSTVIRAPSSPFRGRHTTNPGSNGPVNAKENCPLEFSFVPSGDAADAPRMQDGLLHCCIRPAGQPKNA